jgi:hypothetical protein
MAPFDRRRVSRRTAVLGLAVAGTLSLLAPPASAGATRAHPAAKGEAKAAAKGEAKGGAEAAVKSKPALLPVEGSACLFPIPGQECSEEERRLCDSPPAPDPVVVDCHDPASAWVLEMVGECECVHMHPWDAHVEGERERDHDRPRDGTCLDAESCGASRSAAASLGSTIDYQPAIDRVPAGDHAPARRLLVPPEVVRRHPGYPRDIEHPPRV